MTDLNSTYTAIQKISRFQVPLEFSLFGEIFAKYMIIKYLPATDSRDFL